jgi:hypothetical protein
MARDATPSSRPSSSSASAIWESAWAILASATRTAALTASRSARSTVSSRLTSTWPASTTSPESKPTTRATPAISLRTTTERIAMTVPTRSAVGCQETSRAGTICAASAGSNATPAAAACGLSRRNRFVAHTAAAISRPAPNTTAAIAHARLM